MSQGSFPNWKKMPEEDMYAKLEKFGVNVVLLNECGLTEEDLQDFAKKIEHILNRSKRTETV